MAHNPPLCYLYRVQNTDGRGPFRPGFTKYWAQPDSPGIGRPSIPSGVAQATDLHMQFRAGGWAFCGVGCRSIGQLLGWFRPAEIIMLKDIGYVICRVPAHAIFHEDEFQVMFFSGTHPSRIFELVLWP